MSPCLKALPSMYAYLGEKNQDRCRHPRENLNGTYDGMFPAPNAWTPFPERQKAKRTNNIKRRVVLLRAMVADDRELLSLCTIRSRVALQNAMPQSPTAPILKGVGCGGPVFIPPAACRVLEFKEFRRRSLYFHLHFTRSSLLV